ncbi:MAG TPA: DUF4391 domain-containing protein [Caulobacteraceae bacterium]
MNALFEWPKTARVGSRIPREALFRRAGGGKMVRALYEAEVDRIVWAFKLFARSVNLPPGGDVAEIQVIHVHLRGQKLDDRVLAHLDKALLQHTWFELIRASPDGPEVQVAAAYKRRSEADGGRLVTLEHWRGDWTPADAPRAKLPPAVTLKGLYGGLLQTLWGRAPRSGETLREQAERLSLAAAQAKAVARLKAQVRREADFAAQVERNRQLRAAEAALRALSDTRRA